jgi:hypothetical protein
LGQGGAGEGDEPYPATQKLPFYFFAFACFCIVDAILRRSDAGEYLSIYMLDFA